VRRQAGLVFELLQGLLQCLFDVIGIGPGAEMHQQLAHVVDAFPNPSVQLIQGLSPCPAAPLRRVAQQLDLDLHEGQ
jgi:hypothetical protein